MAEEYIGFEAPQQIDLLVGLIGRHIDQHLITVFEVIENYFAELIVVMGADADNLHA